MSIAKAPLLRVRDLRVTFHPPRGSIAAVRGIDFEVAPGQILGIVGESGSGKSVTFRSLLGLTPVSATSEGAVTINGESGSPAAMANAARSMTALVYQNPGAALNPVFRIGQQLALVSNGKSREELVELLTSVGLPDPERALDAYPHEFSGGMQQRAVIAMALAQEPQLLVADEPTTALDVTTETQILDLLAQLRNERHLAIVIISHDLGVIRSIADSVLVMKDGEVVESGPTNRVLTRPEHPYTQMLVAAVPGEPPAAIAAQEADEAFLDIRGLTVDYRSRTGTRGKMVRVIEGLDLTVVEGETVALVGESGSGKSTLANAIAGLVPGTEGSIRFDGTELTNSRRRATRARLQMVFQNPGLSLSPRRTIRWQLHEPLRLHTDLARDQREVRIRQVSERLGLHEDLLDRKPHQLSGGQAQRVVLARALLLEPALVVFDEPTSALDVSVQSDVLALLAELKAERGLTYLFITHDLAVARQIADRIAVMRHGEIVELRASEALFTDPQHPYSRALISSSSALAAPRPGDLL